MKRGNGRTLSDKSRRWLWVECLVLFFLAPTALYPLRRELAFRVVPLMLPVTLAALVYLRRRKALCARQWRGTEPVRRHFAGVMAFFVPTALALTLLTWWWVPERLFAFPAGNPRMWTIVMIAYPLLAAYPQEVVFRAFFFDRYAPLFRRPATTIAANAAGFGLAHLFYGNWVAPVLSGLGGALFAYRYHRTGSLLLVSLEHGLWGDFLFTVGIGWFFYSGSIR